MMITIPIEVLIDHHSILVTVLCQAFRLGQDFNLKNLKSRLLIPFTKCLKIKIYSFL